MAGVEKAPGADFVVQFPEAIVSSSPTGVRTVVVNIAPSAPVLKTVQSAVSSGASNVMSDFSDLDKRLRTVETDVATVKERLNHVPTKADMQTMLNGVQAKVLWAIFGLAVAAVVKWAWPVLFASHSAS
ncbi:hypothetical protein [Stenotrophomonas sp. 9(2022)]|uniref:hypothetical protein n=1 Tax=Stenotrophomonas sp. 9(2022) TaxID=2950153 RepID=UPI0021150652|nr:hypothetical protein [Stenotrophomonas sp. 9(2022)]